MNKDEERWWIIYPIKNEIRSQVFTNYDTKYVWNDYCHPAYKKNEYAFETLEKAKEGLIKKKKNKYSYSIEEMLISKKELEDALNGNIKIYGDID